MLGIVKAGLVFFGVFLLVALKKEPQNRQTERPLCLELLAYIHTQWVTDWEKREIILYGERIHPFSNRNCRNYSWCSFFFCINSPKHIHKNKLTCVWSHTYCGSVGKPFQMVIGSNPAKVFFPEQRTIWFKRVCPCNKCTVKVFLIPAPGGLPTLHVLDNLVKSSWPADYPLERLSKLPKRLQDYLQLFYYGKIFFK